jgi:hypothetical protein
MRGQQFGATAAAHQGPGQSCGLISGPQGQQDLHLQPNQIGGFFLWNHWIAKRRRLIEAATWSVFDAGQHAGRKQGQTVFEPRRVLDQVEVHGAFGGSRELQQVQACLGSSRLAAEPAAAAPQVQKAWQNLAPESLIQGLLEQLRRARVLAVGSQGGQAAETQGGHGFKAETASPCVLENAGLGYQPT